MIYRARRATTRCVLSLNSIATEPLKWRDTWLPVTFSSRHPVQLLIATLSRAVLREDAEFHTYQMLEAGVQQYWQWADSAPGRLILIPWHATLQPILQLNAHSFSRQWSRVA